MCSPPPFRTPWTRRSSPVTVVALVALAALAMACGLRIDPSDARYRGYFTSEVSAAGSVHQAGGEWAHGGLAQVSTEASEGQARPLAPGEVYRGRERLQVRLPDLDRAVTAVTYPQWAALFLPRIGAPVCGNNVVAVVAWQAQEGTRAAWNPLATTRGMPGATRFNGVGVMNYVSLEQGLDATVATLIDGLDRFGYGPVVAALQRCAPPLEAAAAIQASLWCRDCAGGRYLTAVVPAVIDDFNRALAPRSVRP